ncbi:hypothetical protein HOD05_00220 [Candidatus Woesearchaeota archaeon]|jgi:hypothetical protein|nr:hypothetical protein [Candidatus Woesearchaeota archaeon]MBT4150835.1 hypothetical protein [Candidatus Woesearchaeota archaeon]MBT4246940.1 hypothetical protein [Candidatus Woesearchaeota archaeon]MBT4433625.1 hypothetical protein [Candidatus Woesearchaeota archaeon]MBT7332601.1 hypothetical protein [Candidatus Woesearchaeota archaeon]
MGWFSKQDSQLRSVRAEILALFQAAQNDISSLEASKKNPQGAAPGDVVATANNQIAVRKNTLADNVTAKVQELKS